MGTKEQWDPPRFGAYFQEKEPCFPICAPSPPPLTFPSISSTRELVRDADSRARPQTSWTWVGTLRSLGDSYALHRWRSADLEVCQCLGFCYPTGILWFSLCTEARLVCCSCPDTNWISPSLKRKQQRKRTNLPLWDVHISKPYFLPTFPVLSPAW